MVFISQHRSPINNELSALLRVVRTQYHGEIKLQITAAREAAPLLSEVKLNVLRGTPGLYRYLFLIKIPKLYPAEPLWAEPVIVGKEMRAQFKADDFKSYKLRPLIDNILIFCQKFQSINIHNLVISYPATRFSGDEHVAAKVCILINKALAKMNPPVLSSLPQNVIKSSTESIKLKQAIGFYNDMGINIINYINMYDKFRDKSITFNYLKNRTNKLNCKKNMVFDVLSNGSILQPEKEIVSKMKDRDISELSSCKLNFCNIKNIIASLLMIPDQITRNGFQDDITIEMGENFRIHIKMSYYSLIIQETSLIDFISFVHYSYPHCEHIPNNLRFSYSSSILPLHSRQIISVEINSQNVLLLLNKFNTFIVKKIQPIINKKVHKINVLSKGKCNVKMHVPVYCKVLGQIICPFNDTCHAIESKNLNVKQKPTFSVTSKLNNVAKTTVIKINYKNYLLCNRNKMSNISPFKGDFSNDETESTLYTPTNILTVKCLEIISEIIHYPKQQSDPFEYFLELNPQNDRHQIIFDCLGFVEQKDPVGPEILASSNYNHDFFYLKENINVNDIEFIRLHKLLPNNFIYTLINEENQQYKNLEKVNKNVWCRPKTSEFMMDFMGSFFNISAMYLDKIRRQRLMKGEAKKLNYSDLTIRRCHFYNEFIESITIFCKSQ